MLHLLHEMQLVSVSQHSTHPPLLTVNNTRTRTHTHNAHTQICESVAVQVKCRIWEKDTVVGQILPYIATVMAAVKHTVLYVDMHVT